VVPVSLTQALSVRPIVLDGGLATQLEAQGADLSGALWSAQLLAVDPSAISDAHEAFFAAGAEVATTASYQVSYEGFARAGMDASYTDALLRRSVQLARDAEQSATQRDGRPRWVAASVGPYGAMLADGSEYRGNYGLNVAELREFHRRRLEVLVSEQPDVLAIETIPELAEVEALVDEVERLRFPAWISLTVERGRVRGGADLDEAFACAGSSQYVMAVGVNCSDPDDVVTALARARVVSRRVGVAYPNSGERWDASARTWTGDAGLNPMAVTGWLEAGARLVGGCCRVRPGDIRVIAEAVAQWQDSSADEGSGSR
jgi:homocysteine S-methyltransferase